MNREEQIALLKSGAKNWNKWRKYNPEHNVDLNGAHLSGLDLNEANLKNANMKNANLSWTKLERANLSGARLYEANFYKAQLNKSNFNGAFLDRANLRLADLREAMLLRVSLQHTDLYDAILLKTQFGGSTFDKTNICRINLSEAIGLESAIHSSSSSIGSDTFLLSKGRIPIEFLRGCGLQDWEIEHSKLYKENLTTDQITEINYKVIELRGAKPINYFSTFISYSAADKDFVDKLYIDLQNNGIRCWYAPEDMKGGRKLHEQIFTAINLYEKLLIVLSQASINSKWVRTEIRQAIKDEQKTGDRKLFPISIVHFENLRAWESFYADIGTDLAEEIREYFIPDFTDWDTNKDKYQKSFDRLVRDLRAE